MQIDVVIGGCDKHTLKLPSELGYGSSVACCGEGKYSLLLLVSIVCLPSRLVNMSCVSLSEIIPCDFVHI